MLHNSTGLSLNISLTCRNVWPNANVDVIGRKNPKTTLSTSTTIKKQKQKQKEKEKLYNFLFWDSTINIQTKSICSVIFVRILKQ